MLPLKDLQARVVGEEVTEWIGEFRRGLKDYQTGAHDRRYSYPSRLYYPPSHSFSDNPMESRTIGQILCRNRQATEGKADYTTYR